MPEGPEVRTIADWLNSQVLNKEITSLKYNSTSRYYKTGIVDHDKLNALLPMKITEIEAKGKKIFFGLENNEGDFVFLVSSLMMEGKWTWEKTKHSDLWFETKDKKLYFNDTRHFGTLEIFLSEEELKNRISDLGPDLLNDNVSVDVWKKKISEVANGRSKKLQKIGLFLMEQKYFCGIGNYLRAEILYAAKISPHRLLCEISNDESEQLFKCCREIIASSYNSQGATLATYRNPHGGKGSFEVVVYNKSHDPNGNEVIGEDIGDKRTTHWVPKVQK